MQMLASEFRARVIGGAQTQARASRDLLYGILVDQIEDMADIEREVASMEPGSNRIEVRMKLMDIKARLARQARDMIGLGGGEVQEDTLIEEAVEVR